MGVPKSSGGSGLTRGKKFREIEFHEFFSIYLHAQHRPENFKKSRSKKLVKLNKSIS